MNNGDKGGQDVNCLLGREQVLDFIPKGFYAQKSLLKSGGNFALNTKYWRRKHVVKNTFKS